MGLISLSDLNGIEISVETLLHSYAPKWYNSKTENGRLMFALRPHKTRLVICPPMKYDDNDPWRERYCFVSRKRAFGILYNKKLATRWKLKGMSFSHICYLFMLVQNLMIFFLQI